jgi:hypothetical protein
LQRFVIAACQLLIMKFTFYILLLLITLIGCAKDETRASIERPTVWKETDHYYSIGGPLIWSKPEAGKEETIQFKTNNEFYSSQQTNLNRYTMETTGTGNANLKLYEEGKTDTIRWIIYDVTPNTMKIGFEGCIEGCGKKFTRL